MILFNLLQTNRKTCHVDKLQIIVILARLDPLIRRHILFAQTGNFITRSLIGTKSRSASEHI